jgi:hypothetical protein
MNPRKTPQSVLNERRIVEIQERWHLLMTRAAVMAGLLAELSGENDQADQMTVFRLLIGTDTECRALVVELATLIERNQSRAA